jgi:hypothetical protein
MYLKNCGVRIKANISGFHPEDEVSITSRRSKVDSVAQQDRAAAF